jgi:hypothetical protein
MPALTGTGRGMMMPYSLLVLTALAAACPTLYRKNETKNMDIKIKGLVRRQLVYGFESEKNQEGQVIGASVVKLARRNAFELVGLRRPVPVPAWRWNMS